MSSALFIHPTHITLVEAEFRLPLFYKLLPAAGSLLGAGSALLLYHPTKVSSPELAVRLTGADTKMSFANITTVDSVKTPLTERLGFRQTLDGTGNKNFSVQRRKIGYAMYSFFNGKYFFDVIYNHYIINKALELGLVTSKVLDRGLVEKMGPFGLTDSFYSASRQVATLDTGVVTSYALYIILGFISLTLLLFVPAAINSTGASHGLGEIHENIRLILLFVAGLV